MASFTIHQVEVKSQAVHLIFSSNTRSIPTTMSYSWGVIIFAALFGMTSAAPSLLPRQAATTQLTFTGAGASFSVNAPVDGSAISLSKRSQPVKTIPIRMKLTFSQNRQYPRRRLHCSSRDCELFLRGRRWSEAHRTRSQLRRHHRTTPDDRACQLPIAAAPLLGRICCHFMSYERRNRVRQAVNFTIALSQIQSDNCT